MLTGNDSFHPRKFDDNCPTAELAPSKAMRRLHAILLLSAGCSGVIGESSNPHGEVDPILGELPPVEAECDPAAILAPEHRVRRLTHDEYRNTVADLFGVDTAELHLSADPGQTRFSNDLEDLVASEALVGDYANNARIIAGAAGTSWSDAFERCALDVACIDDELAQLALPVVRRPLDDDVRERLANFYVEERSVREAGDAAALVLEALLQSPHFLYRTDTLPRGEGTTQVDDWALASRLSFFLWQTTPEERLLQLAAEGRLSDLEVLEAEARRLINDERASRTVGAFSQDLLQTHRLFDEDRALRKDPEAFPEWDEELRQSMEDEVARFAQGVYESGGTVADMLQSRTTQVDARLAALYGVEAPAEGWHEVELPADQRAGMLTLAGFVAGHAGTRDPSPVHTGIFVKHDILCGNPTPDPIALGIEPELSELDETMTNRERWESDTGRSPCVSCHREINALGYAFEGYDAIGAHRVSDRGRPVDASGEVSGSDVDGTFDDAVQLAERLAESQRAQRCYANHWFGYAHGRAPRPDDAPAIACIADRMAELGGRIDELLVAIVTDPSFRTVRRSAEEL